MITELHAANYYAYGSRRMWKALLRCGERVGCSRVERLMRENGLQGAKRRGKPWRTTRADPAALRSSDRVKRDFTAFRPDEKWFADFTYLRCWEGAVFFSFVIDAYSRMIVGWQFASHMRTGLVLDALRMALHQRAPGADVSLVAHSDVGSQYTSFDYTQLLDDHDVLGRSGPSAMPTTTPSPRASSTASRPSSSLSAPGHRARSSSSPFWSTSRGSTTSASTNPSTTATTRSRGTLRCEKQANQPHQPKIGNLQTPSPRNTGRLSGRD